MNDIYARTARGTFLTEKGKAFKNRCTSTVRELLLRVRRLRALPPTLGWRLMVLFWLPRLETVQWTETGKGRRFTRRDLDNLEKLTFDGVFTALGEDDSGVVGLTTDKKFGYGEGRLDFMLKEETVPTEEPNSTEIADEINTRQGALRVSPTDPPAMLYHYKAHVPASGEYRYTHFDAWRLHIMDTILEKFEERQGSVKCPARSGRLDACFECSDFMVVHCVLNNPIAIDDGKRSGLFDLCQQRVGTHVALVDRPKGGERMEAQQQPAAKTPSAHFIEILNLLGKVEQDPRLLSPAMTAMYTLLAAVSTKKDGQQEQEACIRLAVTLSGLIEAGAGHPLPRSVIYYRDVTQANMPDDIRARMVKAGGAYKICVEMYTEYRKLFMAWAKGQTQESTGVEPTTTPETKDGPVAQPAPTTEAQPAAEPAPAPEKKTRKTRKEMAQAASPVPEVTADASIEVQPSGDMPKTNPIPPDETPAEEAESPELTPAEEAPAEAAPDTEEPGFKEPGPPPTTHGDINARLTRLEKLVAKLATKDDLLAQMKRLEPIAPAFNALRDWLVKNKPE